MSHVVMLTITNNTNYLMDNPTINFDSGKLDPSSSIPETIPAHTTANVIIFSDKDMSIAGVSGWLQYNTNGGTIGFGFSNPLIGTNKIGTAQDGPTAYNTMDDWDYQQHSQTFTVNGNQYVAIEQATGSGVNTAYSKVYDLSNAS